MDTELAAQAADVRADGRVADPKPGRDLAAGSALGHEPEHLLFAGSEALELRVHLATLVEQGGDRAWREQSAAGGHSSDRIHDLGRGLRLMDERACARLDGREASGIAVFSSEKDELGVGPDLTDAQPCVGPGAVG